ncbi:Peptidase family M1 [Caminicella sporogenes DSM 14501]|uniref:Peptidase family M1 n=1 Tax=Caminicella sporogenes DSM 14501 TaxID=1121266 RepID=A0A1M6SAE8_9FIRM|nr:M1 family metallopeptidase [Caminicella sporogenes]RKD26927.1 hypothetical protein BET04_09960 [Caminicella sporogenes]SHK41528.1 Peptidase family M1 [Caminicella sporogenes DSM 14501]
MFKKEIKILSLVLIFAIFFSSCSVQKEIKMKALEDLQTQKGKLKESLTNYNIEIQFYPDKKMIVGKQEVIYTNNEKVSLDKIYFHLYPNAFKKKETLPFLFDDLKIAFPNGFEEGCINIKNLWVNKERGNFSIGGVGDTIMEVNLPQVLKPGEKISIKMEYEIKIPPSIERFGYKDEIFNLGNWYPIVAVYDKTGWNLDPYYSIGDPFYSDVSNYNVVIKTPKDIIVAATGTILSDKLVGNVREWHIEARKTRDFAWVASKNFEIVKRKVDGILLKVYFIKTRKIEKKIKDLSVKFAEKSIKIFNDVFGKYPYKQYSVVQTNFPSGMEYPQIVFIGKQYYNWNSIDFLEEVIVHETAHQWWYSVVGNDQIDEPWLDESFASYSEVIYYSENYGDIRGNQYYRYENLDRYNEAVDSLKDEAVLKTLSEFKDWNDYSFLVYTKGTVFLDNLKNKYGEKTFYKILKTYYNMYKYKIATTEDFLKVCEEVTGDDLDNYFNKWLK